MALTSAFMEISLEGKVALVTGASRGIGKAIASTMSASGAKVMLTSRKLDALRAAAAEMVGETAVFAANAGDVASADACVRATIERFGGLDIIVNNAATNPYYGPTLGVDEARFDKTFGVNLKGPFRLSSIVGTRMAAGAGGSIINISSIASQRPSPGEAPYGAAKAGVNSLTQSMAAAFGPKVRVNCIVPGPFLTDISKAWDMEAFNARAKSAFALGRGGQPHEIVGAALYLASEASSYTTGAFINIDGLPR